MTLYDSIFSRKSTRRYQPVVLTDVQRERILTFTEAAKPLIPSIRARMELVDASEVKGMVSANAPHYMLLYSEKCDGYLPNAGFLLQQVDLYLCSLGLASCWLGMAKATQPAKDGLDFVIMLALGTAAGSSHRADVSEFNRKPLDEISRGDDERFEAVRLAPSATNSQPWYLVTANACTYVYRKKLGIIKAAIYETMNQIDMGIALCHLWLASEHANRAFEFELGNHADAPKVDGYDCMGKVIG